MGKMTIAEAATHFNVSKEAIHNRIRRGSLDCIIENGVKFVAVAQNSTAASSHTDQRYYDYIEEENKRLRERVGKLENENSSLRDQREAMLIAEREKIEQIYKERDEQLRNVLQVVASKFLSAHNVDQVIDDAISGTDESQDAEVIEARSIDEAPLDDLIALKKYLKRYDYDKKTRRSIVETFEKRLKKDDRIFDIEGKLYIRPMSFDYSDLLPK